MNHPQDHFSSIASKYKAGRISYPKALYDYLENLCSENNSAWDCATGSGQAAVDLSPYFKKIIATDISAPLLALAEASKNIEFQNSSAEESGIPSHSIDLVTVAQAIHWFHFDRFWEEVQRVSKNNAILAFWGYVWPGVNDKIDSILETYLSVVDDYWPERCRFLQSSYAAIEAPFKKLNTPSFHVQEMWSAFDFLAHLESWSSTRYYREALQKDPIRRIKDDLIEQWGEDKRMVRWDLPLKVYQIQ